VDERRFEVKCRLTAEEVVLFDRIREGNGLTTSALVRMYVKEGMAKDATQMAVRVVGNAPNWDDNVRPFFMRGTQ
jgi:hypothetical protein